jgi:spermidine synthase
VTAGSFVLHPGIKRIVICEIEPLIPPAARDYFGEENYGVIKDPRVKVVIDDARHYIATTTETFDIITSDPIHPWVKGAASLYSKEYFELCKKRLNPGGVVTQWVPLYETNEAAVKSEFATFFDAFPHGTIWSNDDRGRGYDIVLLGQLEKTVVNLDAISERLARDDHLPVAESVWKAGFQAGMIALLRTYAGRPADLAEWLKDAEITHDRNMRLQYLAGMGLNAVESESIFDSFVEHVQFPDDLFTGSDKLLDDLYEAWVNPAPEKPAALLP